jgi:diguanylate cyclase (GGDEF)-like protein
MLLATPKPKMDENSGEHFRPEYLTNNGWTVGMDTSMTMELAGENFTAQPGLMSRISALTEQFLRDLPQEVSMSQQTLLERALKYAAETEQRMADQRHRIAELESLSSTDPLTGLLNRRGFEYELSTALSRARRYGEVGVIAYCDLDNLKQVNDALGHTAGDELVKCAAATLAGAVRDLDIVGRLGGDEFAIVLINTNWKNGARRMRTIQWRLDSAGIVHRGNDAPLQVSMGIEPYGPQDSVEDLIHRADMAMYYNKRRKQACHSEARAAAE